MTIYTAPVEEMMFLFDNLKDNQRYKEIEKYKEINSELVKGILEEAAKNKPRADFAISQSRR